MFDPTPNQLKSNPFQGVKLPQVPSPTPDLQRAGLPDPAPLAAANTPPTDPPRSSPANRVESPPSGSRVPLGHDRTATLVGRIVEDLGSVGIPRARLLGESMRGCVAEAIRWSGLYSLTVLALEATINHSPAALGFMAAFCGCYLIADHLDGSGKTAADTLGRTYLRRLRERLLDTLGRSTLRSLSDEDSRSRLELQYDRTASISNLVERAVSLPAYATKMSLSAGALLSVDWRIGTLVTLAVLPVFLLRSKHIVADVALEDRQRKTAQIGERIETETYRTDGAVRMILGGLTRPITRTLSHLQAALDEERDRHERRQNAQLFAAYLGYYGAMFGGLTMLFNQYGAGTIAIGSFAFLCLQLKDLGEELFQHGETYHAFKRTWQEAREFYRFVEPIHRIGQLEFPPTHDLELNTVAFRRGDFELTIPHLSIPAGSFVVIHGGSGAGKTTLLEHLAFAAPPDRGTVTVGGVPLTDLRFSAWRQHIAYCGARIALLEGRSVREILRGSDDTDDNVATRAAHPLIADLIADLSRHAGLDTRVGAGLAAGRGFSTGEQHRLLLTAALIPRPAIVFLDEVTSNQSEDFVATVRDLLSDYAARGTTILFATHSKKFDTAASHLIRVSAGTTEITVAPRLTPPLERHDDSG